MIDLDELVAMTFDEPELQPEILPSGARMSLRGGSEALAELFSRAAAVAVPSLAKEVLPGTSSALIEAVAAQTSHLAYVRATASDGEKTVSIVEGRDIVILREGTVLLPAKRLSEIMKLVPAATTHIEVTGNEATVRSGQALWTVQIPSGEDLTAAVTRFEGQTFPVDVREFSRALSVARRAASTTDARQAMMQIQLRNSAFTACDGGRVHRHAVPLPEHAEVGIEVHAADEILRAIRAEHNLDAGATFGYSQEHVLFEMGNNRVISQRLLVPFPQSVENLVLRPAFTNDYTLTVERRELMDVVRRVRVNANPDSAAILLAVVPGQRNEFGDIVWELNVRARDQHGNSSQEQISCTWTHTKGAELTVNHHYLLDLLDVYTVDQVSFKIGDSTKSQRAPLLIEDSENGFTGVITQMYSVR